MTPPRFALLTDSNVAHVSPTPSEELVSFVAPGSVEADQYRTLRQSVERLRSEANVQVIATTSAAAGDGKTLTTLNLAGSLGQAADARVLVIDADLHRAAVTEYLGLSRLRSPGLADAIANRDVDLARAVRRLDGLNVSILPAGSPRVRPYELLAAPRFEQLVREARRQYDYVLVDTPPVVPLADCRLLSRCVDGFIIVVSAHRTPRKLLAQTLDLIEPGKVAGLVFNGDNRPLSSYYGYYHYAQDGGGSPRRSSWPRRLLTLLRAR